MNAERRAKTTKKYLYSAERVGDRVVKTYLGPSSDPACQIALGRRQVSDARIQLAKHARKRERDAAIAGEPHLIELSLTSRKWPVLERLVTLAGASQLPSDHRHCAVASLETPEPNIMESLPGRAEFAKLCRQVDTGDEVALAQFRRLASIAPELLNDLTDLIAIATEQTIDGIAGDSPSLRESFRLTLENEAKLILGDEHKSALDRMQTEILLLLRLDALRCHVARSRVPENQSEYRFWDSMANRATRRFSRALGSVRKNTGTNREAS